MPTTKKPKYRHTNFRNLVRAADGAKPHYYPVYKTSGRQFMERDQRGPKPT